MTRCCSLVACACLCALTAGKARQTAPAPQHTAGTLQFRDRVDLVQLDVSVLDKKTHLPVRGLTAADFTIIEDDAPQTVAAFAAVDAPDRPQPAAASTAPASWMRDIAPDVQTNVSAGKPESRLFVMVLDDAMIPNEPWIVQQAKKAARSVIDKLSPADRMAVVLTAESGHAQDFTGDRTKLLAAVGAMRPGYAQYFFGWDNYRPPVGGAWQPAVQTDGDIQPREMSFGTLAAVADTLAAAPDRRKILVYISPGIPVNFGLAATVKLADGSGLVSYEANKRLVEDLPEIFRRLQRANVNIYAIDPTGIAGMTSVVRRAIDSLNLHGTQLVDPLTGQSAGPPLSDDLAHFAANLDLNFLEAAATNTGGRAIVNNDNFEPGIEAMFSENASYYLLGYAAPPGDPPGTQHRIRVRVNRPGVDVRTRSGYSTPKPAKVDANHPEATPMMKAVAGLLPSDAVPLQVAVAPFAWTPRPAPVPATGPKRKAGDAPAKEPGAVVAIVLGLQRPAPTQPLSDTVEVQISAFTEDGVARGTDTQEATVAIRPAATAEPVRYEAISHIALEPGRYQLRIAAYSAVSEATGSVYADVEVPDFARAPVSMSGVLLEATPSLPSAPRTSLANLAPIVPTCERLFDKLDRASTFLRVYQGGAGPLAPVTLVTRVVNDQGIAAIGTKETLGPDRFDAASRAADVRFEIPMLTLARGPYLLTFEATRGDITVRRDVRFKIR